MMKFLCTFTFVFFAVFTTYSQTLWTGNADSDWNNTANWSAGVPTSGMQATILGSAPNMPVYDGPTILDLTIDNFGTLTFNSTVYNTGAVTNFAGATINNDGQFINAGNVFFNNDGDLNNNGTFENYGTYDHAASATLNNASSADIISYGSFSSNGQINNDGTLTFIGSFSNTNGMLNNGTFTISGTASFPFASMLDNPTGGVINITPTGSLDMNGSLPNGGTITVDGELIVQNASTLTNDGTFTNNNALEIAGTFINNTTLDNNGATMINSVGTLENNGTVNNNGSISLEICGKLIQNAANNIGGTVSNDGLVYEINGTVDEVNGQFGETFTNINDTPAPVPACKGDIILELDQSGVVNFTGEDIDQGRSYGSCGASLVSFDVTPNQFTTDDIGVQIVTLTITDDFGVTASCQDFVNVIPFQEPIVPIDDPDIDFTCPADIDLSTLPGAQFAEASWTEPTATTTCNGGSNSTIEIMAFGDQGGEQMELFIDGQFVQQWIVTTINTTYTYAHSSFITADDIQVHFTNDQTANGDYNLNVDKITVDGTTYETESPTVYGIGVWDNGTCSVYTNHQDDKLACNGYFQYSTASGVCSPVPLVDWSLDGCQPNTGNDYSEFTPSYPSSGGCQSVSATTIYRNSGGHTCVNPRPGASGLGKGVGTATSCIFQDDDPFATRFEVTVDPQSTGQLTGLTFWESAPDFYDPIDFAGDFNNYPLYYGIRVLKDGSEIYKVVDIPTGANWSLQTFDFSGLTDFQVTATTTFAFELRAYCRVGNGAPFAAWQIDDFSLQGCCSEPTPLCTDVPDNFSGYTLLGEHDNSKYFVSTAQSDWTAANNAAISLGGHLAAISSQSENDFIWNAITVDNVWLGLTTVGTPQVFHWTNGEPVGYTNWQSGEPNEFTGDVAARLRNVSGEWTDRVLSNQYYHVVEIPCIMGGGGGGDPQLVVDQIGGPVNGSIFPTGTTEVAYEVTDACGNQEVCLFDVTVNEVPATFEVTSCPPDQTVNTLPGANTAVVSWSDPTGTSDCFREGPIGVDQTLGFENGSDFPTGTNTVIYVVFDSCGNFGSCQFDVTVNFTPSTLTINDCPVNFNVVAPDGATEAVVSWTEPTASTDCYLNSTTMVTQLSGPPNGGLFPLGTTEVLYLFSDECSNTEICSFTVLVNAPCDNNGGDADSDGTCADVDCDDNDPTIPTTPGTACDDGDSNTENDIIQADGCTCAGTIIDPCLNNGGDADGDGVCADTDCDDNDPSIPTAPGTLCDDGDPLTENDVIQADGCTCAGALPVTLSINDVTVNEDDGVATLDICLDMLSNLDVQVQYITTSGTALAAADFVFGIGTEMILAGNLCISIDVDLVDDAVEEPTEEFTVDLANPINATIADGSGLVTILDDDAPDPCANNGGDADGDGICADVDCDDNDASIPTTPGTACDDGDPLTENDEIQADGCTCTGTPIDPCANNGGDADGDGVCADVDCDDNDASLPTTPGTACDDGDPLTENDEIQADGCTCTGILIDPCANNGGDADGDGVCADVDCDDNDASLPTTPGTACDDGDPLTENDEIQADGCTCTGTPIDPCANNGGDADGDGVCADVDCDDNDASLPTTPGTACDDGDPFTENDEIQADGCTCAGTPIDPCANNGGDADGDGVCADVDCDDNDASLPTTPGTACDDGDPLTENDEIQADGCTCAGTPIDPCANNGGDADGDGVCADVDCDDNDASLPTTPGTACDDGDPLTENDEIQADGCTCAGTPVGGCNPGYSISGNTLTITGLTGPFNAINLFALPAWTTEYSCFANCNTPTEVLTVPDGDYYLHIKVLDENYQVDCELIDNITIDGGGCMPGGSCDDGDPCTDNDVYDINCNCAGTSAPDGDGDGVCANIDCDDNDPNLPTTPGTACDDGDANTENDEIQADGCTCAGTLIDPCLNNGGDADGDGVCADVDCDDNDATLPTTPGTACDDGDPLTENDVIQADGCTCAGTPPGACNPGFSIAGNTLTITGLTGPHNAINLLVLPSWSVEYSCFDDCTTPTEILTVPDGDYYLHIKVLDESYQIDCELIEFITIDGGGCTPGSTCDDGDPCTDNDVLDTNCNCVGTPAADGDGDGVCVNIDCDDSDASLPATPGTSCDDGDPLTENDVILADGCTCAGTPPGGCNVTFTAGAGSITIDGLTAPHVIVHVFDDSWSQVFTCLDDCNDPQLVDNLVDGTYFAKATLYDASWVEICEETEYVTVGGGAPLQGEQSSFLFFTATRAGTDVKLDWMTNTDYKNDYFVVERSLDGQSFEEQAMVSSVSQSTQPTYYDEWDYQPKVGPNFYRIKQVHSDGTFRYSSVEVVYFELELSDFVVYPNPASDQVSVQIDKLVGESVVIQLYNQLGQLVQQKSIDTLSAGPVSFDVSTFTSGIYAITVETRMRKRFTKLFVVSRM